MQQLNFLVKNNVGLLNDIPFKMDRSTQNRPKTEYGDRDELVKEDYALLPDNTRAYQGVAQSNCLSVSPSSLRFPHDDPEMQFAELVVWNKMNHSVDYRIIGPMSKHFEIFRGKTRLFAGTQDTVLVKCKPYAQKLFYDSIKIQATSELDDVITIPLEIMPNPNWFILPKIIIMPTIPIGQRFELVLPFPKPSRNEENLNYFITNTSKDVIEVEPSEGVIFRSIGCSKKEDPKTQEATLSISYSPRGFISTVCTIGIHFPQISMRPFTITIFGKCDPGLYSEVLRQTLTQHNENTATTKNAKRYPRFKLDNFKKPKHVSTAELSSKPNLNTPAAIMKFLCQPAKEDGNLNAIGPLGLSAYQVQSNYKAKEKEFHDKLIKQEIDEHTFRLQRSKQILGQDPINSMSDICESIKLEREKEQYEYDTLLGRNTKDLKDFVRKKVETSNPPQIRDLDAKAPTKIKYKQLIPAIPPVYLHSHHGDSERRTVTQPWARKEILRPFLQTAFTIITRLRADKRISKLRILVKSTKAKQAKLQSQAKSSIVNKKDFDRKKPQRKGV